MVIHFTDGSTLTTKETLNQCESFGDRGFYVNCCASNSKCLVLWANIKYITELEEKHTDY